MEDGAGVAGATGAAAGVVADAAGADDDLLVEDLLAGRDSSAREPWLNANRIAMPIKTAFMKTPWVDVNRARGPLSIRTKNDLP